MKPKTVVFWFVASFVTESIYKLFSQNVISQRDDSFLFLEMAMAELPSAQPKEQTTESVHANTVDAVQIILDAKAKRYVSSICREICLLQFRSTKRRRIKFRRIMRKRRISFAKLETTIDSRMKHLRGNFHDAA